MMMHGTNRLARAKCSGLIDTDTELTIYALAININISYRNLLLTVTMPLNELKMPPALNFDLQRRMYVSSSVLEVPTARRL